MLLLAVQRDSMFNRGKWIAAVLIAGSIGGAAGLVVGSSGEEPPPTVVEVPVLAITEVPVEVIKEVPVEVIVEVPVVTEVEVIVEVPISPTWCPTRQEISSTLAWLEEARSTHVIWADYLSNHELQDPLARQGLGTVGFHQEWVARYATMIGVAQTIEGIC